MARTLEDTTGGNMKARCAALAALILVVAGAAVAAEKSDKNAKKRGEIDAMASRALDQVLAKSSAAKEIHKKSVGYAAFENVKVALGVSGGGGNGVAVPKSGKRVYMKMGTAGIGFGLGGQKYQVVFFFETETALQSFVDTGWQADVSAQAAAADQGANVGATFKDGIAVFQLTDKGLMASADVAGTKYWKNAGLNE
jgi:lipid-binding SYLF domain-containing protein